MGKSRVSHIARRGTQWFWSRLSHSLGAGFGSVHTALHHRRTERTRNRENDSGTEAYSHLLERFDPMHPGAGLDAYRPYQVLHHPMAYALFAMAETRMHGITRNTEHLQRAMKATRWLLDHQPHPCGWGLNFPHRTFNKPTPNAASTPYAITTALAIHALLDVTQASGDETFEKRAIEVAKRILRYATSSDDTGLWPWYSPMKDDDHPTFNVTAMLAGQLKRTSESTLGFAADEMIRHVLHHRQVEPKRTPTWFYTAQGHPSDSRPNDLVHHAYIVYGLTQYTNAGGTIDISMQELHDSLTTFERNDIALEYPNRTKQARPWGIGAARCALESTKRHPPTIQSTFDRTLDRALTKYAMKSTVFYPRQATHVLWGLANPTPNQLTLQSWDS